MNSNLDNKASRYKKIDVTLSSGSWSGSSAPYTYTVSASGVTTTNDINVILNSTDTSVANAWMSLSIINGTQSTDNLVLYAYGKKPSVDIPITILIGDEVNV